MAGELVTYMNIAFNGLNGIKDRFEPADGLATDYDTSQMRHGTQEIGETEAEFIRDGVDSVGNGWLWLVNRDDSNEVQIIGASGEDPLVLLRAGEVAGFRLNANPAFTAKTTSGTAVVEFYQMGGNT